MSEEELKLASEIADKLGIDLVVVDRDYNKFWGKDCKCGYFLGDADYELKGRDTDYIDFVCEQCGYIMRVYLEKLPKLSEVE